MNFDQDSKSIQISCPWADIEDDAATFTSAVLVNGVAYFGDILTKTIAMIKKNSHRKMKLIFFWKLNHVWFSTYIKFNNTNTEIELEATEFEIDVCPCFFFGVDSNMHR